MRPEGFLPRIVLEHEREKPWQEWVTGTVLFADVSGFTPMSEDLSVLGAEGAEILTQILNRYFASMIGIIEAHGGQVMKFGGDALQCFFPETRSQKPEAGRGNVAAPFMGAPVQEKARDSATPGCHPELDSESSLIFALRAARLMQDAMPRFQNIKTPVRKFALKMKIGLAHGECLLAGVGDPAVRCEFLFAGGPVDAACKAEHHASPGDIVFSCGRNFQGAQDLKMQNAKCNMKHVEPGFYRIVGWAGEHETRNLKLETAAQAKARGFGHIPPRPSRATSCQLPAAVSAYLIAEVHAMVAAGYAAHVGALLEVVPAFLRFEGFCYTRKAFDLEAFHRFFLSLMAITQRYDGRLSQVSAGDKGSHLLVLFGAPNALEKKEELASQWALDAQSLIPPQFPDLSIRIGMHAGRCFAGIVGGAGRSGYTVMGDAVNTAARLMQGAQEGQACVSDSFREKAQEQFAFESLGTRKFKGKEEQLAVWVLKGKKRATLALEPKKDFVGRVEETGWIAGLVRKARTGQPGMAVIEGEAGVGKSYLADHVLGLARKEGWRIHFGRGEIARQGHAYAPWGDLLQGLCFPDSPPDLKVLKKLLTKESAPYLAWHADLFHLPANRVPPPPTIDEETRKNLFHHQLSTLILDMALKGPILLFLDDLQWFDTLSLDLLKALLNHLKDQEIFILAATRSDWVKKDFMSRPACVFTPLTEMDKPTLAALAASVLQGPVREDLVQFVHERTGGNPFFSRQLLDYMRLEGFIQSRLGEWTVSREAASKGAQSGEEIIIAQAGRLSPSEKIHLQMAACIGPTFQARILEHALGRSFRPKALQVLMNSGFFVLRGESGTVSFPHTLLQETLYHAIPQKTRKAHHRRIGNAMEALLSDHLDDHASDLANHFFAAGVRPKTLEYSIRAGNRLYHAMAFPEACRYFARGYALLRRNPDESRYEIGFMFIRALIKAGKLQEGLKCCKEIINAAKKRKLTPILNRAIIHQSDILRRTSNYTYITTLLAMVRQHRAKDVLYFEALHLIGAGYYWLGQFSKAERYLGPIIQPSNMKRPSDPILSAFVFLAAIEKNRGRYDKAREYLNQGMNASREAGNAYQELRLQITLADVLWESGHHEQAKGIFIELLPQVEQIGDYYLQASILNNIGKIECDLGNVDCSTKYLIEASSLFQNLGISIGLSSAIMQIGTNLFLQNRFGEAYDKYISAAQHLERTQDMQLCCHAYYNLAEVCLYLGKLDEGLEWHRKGLLSFKPEDNPQLHKMFMELGEKLRLKM